MDRLLKRAVPKGNIFSRENLFNYANLIGIGSYYGLGMTVSDPGLFRTRQFNATNTLLVGSVVGVTAYMYDRRHLQDQKTKKRLWMSAYASGLFNCGSLLVWAILRSATQDVNLHPIFRSFLSIAASYYMILSGLHWIDIIDTHYVK